MRSFPCAAAAVVLLAACASCHDRASEPAPTPSEDGVLHHDTHRILEGDHRHVLKMRVEDRIALPADPAFVWHVDFEDRSAFARVTEPGDETYRILKAGPYRMMVYGEPKCLKSDAGCGLSKRRWDVTVDVR